MGRNVGVADNGQECVVRVGAMPVAAIYQSSGNHSAITYPSWAPCEVLCSRLLLARGRVADNGPHPRGLLPMQRTFFLVLVRVAGRSVTFIRKDIECLEGQMQ